MNFLTPFPVIDTVVVIIANLINLGMVAIFLVRARGQQQLEHSIGLGQLTLTLPLLMAAVINISNSRPWWTFFLPGLMVAFLLVELLLDYIMQLDFRRTRLLGPYLGLYYLSMMGLIGYAFLTNELLGFVTLITYFLQLAATAYSYRQVGHGRPPSPGFSGENG